MDSRVGEQMYYRKYTYVYVYIDALTILEIDNGKLLFVKDFFNSAFHIGIVYLAK